MSNCIPKNHELEDPCHVPYCIWHPDIAQEETYRVLARHYPMLRYQVGRACAVAGYVGLYRELDLLPDVSIAEEARESNTDGGREIFGMIMALPIRYAVMNDLRRSVNPETKSPAFLNGDTTVRWMLEERKALPRWREAHSFYSDIEEDCRLGEDEVELPDWRREYTEEEAKLLYTPLPLDLPTVKKDLLLQMAAYEGNVDRYAQLMRPGYMEETEGFCVVRGIFHHTMFARWWAEQLEVNPDRIRTPESYEVFNTISEAINARRVMINEISGFNDDTEYLPYMICWPLKPMELTLELLAKQCPKMKYQIAIACIFCNYERLYRKLQVRPHYHIWLAAEQSPNSFYRSDLEVRAAELGFDVSHPTYYWTRASADWLARDLEPTTDFIFSPLNPYIMSDEGQRLGTYFEYNIQSGVIERYVWQRPDLMHKLASHGNSWRGTLGCMEDLDLMEEEEIPASEGVSKVTTTI